MFIIGNILGAFPCNTRLYCSTNPLRIIHARSRSLFGVQPQTLPATLSDLKSLTHCTTLVAVFAIRRLQRWLAVQTRPASVRQGYAMFTPWYGVDGVIQGCRLYVL